MGHALAHLGLGGLLEGLEEKVHLDLAVVLVVAGVAHKGIDPAVQVVVETVAVDGEADFLVVLGGVREAKAQARGVENKPHRLAVDDQALERGAPGEGAGGEAAAVGREEGEACQVGAACEGGVADLGLVDVDGDGRDAAAALEGARADGDEAAQAKDAVDHDVARITGVLEGAAVDPGEERRALPVDAPLAAHAREGAGVDLDHAVRQRERAVVARTGGDDHRGRVAHLLRGVQQKAAVFLRLDA